MFRARQKKSDTQPRQADSKPESSALPKPQPHAEPRGDDNGGSVIESNPPERLEAEPRLDVALREVGDFLAGRSGEASRIDPAEKALRGAIAGELLAVISGSKSQSASPSNSGAAGKGKDRSPTKTGTGDSQIQQIGEQATDAAQTEQNRARQLFMGHGYFAEVIESLRASSSASERAAAAHTLGIVGDRLGNVHLIAALFDSAPEVRDAATEALARLGDSAAANAAMISPPVMGSPTVSLSNELGDEASRVEGVQEAQARAEVAASPVTIVDKSAPDDEAKLLLEEEATRKALRELRQRLGVTASSRARLEKETRLRLEGEATLGSEAAARRREEEEVRQRAEEEASRRRAEENEKVAAAHSARVKADEEAHRFAQEDAKLRLEVNKLRVAAEELARTRADMQAERAAAAERARLAETQLARQEAEAKHKAEVERLRREEEALRTAVAESTLRREEVETARQVANGQTLRLAEERDQLAVAEAALRAEVERVREAEARARGDQEQLLLQVEGMRHVAEEVAVRRAEVEAAREKAVEEAQRLVEAQARMKAADEVRQQAEAERARLEAEMLQRAEEEARLLDEVRLRAQEAQQRLEEDERNRAAEQEQKLAHLTSLRQRLEAESQERDEKERQISSQIESFRLADMQARKRIEDAEARRRTAEDSYLLVAEKTQRVEAEARKGEIEQERILARLEEVRRNVAVGTQAAAEQEKRVKEETEQLRRIEEAQRGRLDEAIRNRAEAERRLQQERDRLQSEEDARVRAAEQFSRLLEKQRAVTPEAGTEWRDEPAENLRPSKRATGAEPGTVFTGTPGFAAPVGSATSVTSPVQDNGSYFSTGTDGLAAVYEETKSADAQVSSNSDTPHPAPASTLVPPAFVTVKDEVSRISAGFDDPSPDVRNAAARELRELDPQHMVESFNRALEEATPERRRNIGGAIAASGVAAEVIEMLGGESREETYSALCLLLTMAKSGEVEPLVRAIEHHENVYVRIAAVRLLTLNGQEEIANAAARRRLEGRI